MTARYSRTFDPWACSLPRPPYDVRKLVRRFETVAAVEQEAEKRVKALRKAPLPGAGRLAAALADCGAGQRCGCSICPRCTRRYRVVVVGQLLSFWNSYERMIFITIVPADEAVGPGHLHEIWPKRLKDRLRQQMRRLVIPGPVIGGLDLDFDPERDVWQPHFHLIALVRHKSTLAALRRFHQPTDDVSVPVRFDAVNDRARQVSYCFKGYAPRTVRYQTPRGRRWPRHTRLKPKQFAEWLMWRSQFPSNEFLFLVGARHLGGTFRQVGHGT
jgi:hypothetical protein